MTPIKTKPEPMHMHRNNAHVPIASKPLCKQRPDPKPRKSQMSPVRAKVEEVLRTTERYLTVKEICEITGLEYVTVENCIHRLNGIKATGRRGYNIDSQPAPQRRRAYRILPSDPVPVPTLLPKRADAAPPRAMVPDFAFDPTTYAWPHLADPVRVDADTHKGCGSRRGEKVEPYAGPSPMCVGTGLGIYGPGRAGSAPRG